MFSGGTKQTIGMKWVILHQGMQQANGYKKADNYIRETTQGSIWKHDLSLGERGVTTSIAPFSLIANPLYLLAKQKL